MRIPDSKIDEIRSATDIVEIVSASVRLKKRGKNYLGLCPFHTEKTPSFTVSPEKQMYHCFGCGAGGNVFTFVMQVEKVAFPEAIRILAERAGIALPRAGGTEEAVLEPLYNACRIAGLHFHENLFSGAEGGRALDYLRKRGFSDETIRKFGLGYSMNSWDDLLRFGTREGIETAILEKAGLVARREDGSGYYDRFRGRAMFPIFSGSGRTIGFGARKLRDDDPVAGKYINSPETPIYDKSRVLFGLYQAKEAIRAREFAVLVEGYADLISLFQEGIENVVATSGTALTDEQIRLIGRYTHAVTLVYDADSAGSKAMMKGVDLIIARGLDVKVAGLPQGEDPDSFVRSHGREAFQGLLDTAVTFLDFKVSQYQAMGLFATPEGQTRAVRAIVQTIATMDDELKRNLYIKHLAEHYGIYETVLFRELEQQLTARGKEKFAGPRTPVPVPSVRPEGQPVSPGPMHPAERDLLRVMLEHGHEVIRFVEERFPADRFTDRNARVIFELLKEQAESGGSWDPARLVDGAKDEEAKKTIAHLLFDRYDISKGWLEQGSAPEEADPIAIAERCIARKQVESLEDEIRENQRKMSEASTKGEPLRPFLERHQELMKEKQHLTRVPSG
jgi:DNA primase